MQINQMVKNFLLKAIIINSLESLELDTRYKKEKLLPSDYKPIALVVTELEWWEWWVVVI